MNKFTLFLTSILFFSQIWGAELSGVSIAEKYSAENGESLILNGYGLREKFWVDIYVGSLYLPRKTSSVAEILSFPNAFRVQLDFVYKEVSKDKLLSAWRDGFGMNQTAETMTSLKPRMEQFYSYFSENAVAKDQYIFDYIPGKGTTIRKNKTLLGTIPGEDFKNALLEIWLGDYPADNSLKKGMLGM